MTDERMVGELSGHAAPPHGNTLCVMELDGLPVAVGVDRDAVLWTCDLVSGDHTQRPLDLNTPGPGEDWYSENGWDEEDEFDRSAWRADPYEVASRLSVAHLGGVPVIVSGAGRFELRHPYEESISGGVRVWDMRSGRMIGGTLTGHDLGVCSLTTLPTEHGLLAVSSSEEGTLLVWNLTSKERVAKLPGNYNGGMGAALVGNRPIAVTGGDDSFCQAWDLLKGERMGKPLTGIDPVVRGIAITEVAGRAVVVAGGDGEKLHVWDLATQEPTGPPMAGHTDSIETLGTAVVGGHTVAVTGSNDGTTRVWDLARGEQIGAPLSGDLKSVAQFAGVPVAVTTTSTDSGSVINVWDLTRVVR